MAKWRWISFSEVIQRLLVPSVPNIWRDWVPFGFEVDGVVVPIAARRSLALVEAPWRRFHRHVEVRRAPIPAPARSAFLAHASTNAEGVHQFVVEIAIVVLGFVGARVPAFVVLVSVVVLATMQAGPRVSSMAPTMPSIITSTTEAAIVGHVVEIFTASREGSLSTKL